MKRKILLISTFIFVFIFWVMWTNLTIATSYFEIENKKIPSDFSGFKIAEVSDLHNRQWGQTLIKKIKAEKPDIITITGDLIDSSHTNFDQAMQFIEEANKLAPIYYVTGNHEAWIENYAVLEGKLKSAKVMMMDDKSVFIEKEKNKIHISGIQDPDFFERENDYGIQGARTRTKLTELLEKEFFTIVLSHRPEQFEQYVAAGANLVLAGHAHGGQVRIPFIGGLVAPNQGFFPKYTEGLHSKKNTKMVVSRGLGNSIIPIRINNTPELVIITLKTK
ncbi:MAG: metallophosphoesterase [Carnobacterium sp.]|nr:metallophosphoesterase [Carnobacterium sp.]